MSVFSWLKGDKPLPSTGIAIRDSGGLSFITVQSLSFYGCCERSANGRYIVAWRDGNDEGAHGGARTAGKGRYLLIDADRVVVDARLERPNDGHVADNGCFVLNDWRFFTNQLRGTFYAFQVDGSEILRQSFRANLYNCGIARDGRFACCQTANSDSEKDSSVLAIFDLEKGSEIARWQPESGWASRYTFSDEGTHILLGYNQGPPLRYTLAGDFVDRALRIDSSLARGDLTMIQRVIKETHPKPQGAFAQRLVACIDIGLAAVPANDPRTRAFGLKLKAICFDGLEDWRAALAAYDAALALDPKLGVKRRIEQLRKNLAP